MPRNFGFRLTRHKKDRAPARVGCCHRCDQRRDVVSPEHVVSYRAAGDHLMTTLAKLQAQKQQLIEELQGDIGPEERNQIERLLEQIDAALDSLDEAGPAVLPRPR
jgi:hypothetical protein